MKTMFVLALVIYTLIPQSGYANQVEIFVDPNPGDLLSLVRSPQGLSDQDSTSVKYWEVGRVSISDFENYQFAVIKNGRKLDDIVHKNTAIFYTGDYVIQVFDRQSKELVATAYFSSQSKLKVWQYLLLTVALLASVLGLYLLKCWIDNERLIRRRGWRYP